MEKTPNSKQSIAANAPLINFGIAEFSNPSSSKGNMIASILEKTTDKRSEEEVELLVSLI